jgi:hypothetical protein
LVGGLRGVEVGGILEGTLEGLTEGMSRLVGWVVATGVEIGSLVEGLAVEGLLVVGVRAVGSDVVGPIVGNKDGLLDGTPTSGVGKGVGLFVGGPLGGIKSIM